ncbi:MAG: biotin carboxylase, partial [Porticoccaceae bacterium]|nr:biotin carboxylase [Porticoccaceae bacterium]
MTKIKTQPQPSINVDKNQVLADFKDRLKCTLDEGRPAPIAKHHARGYRSARENLEDLCDTDSFLEYGQLAVAAQRKRREF